MGLALVSSHVDSQAKGAISLESRQEIMSFEKELQPLLGLLLLKLEKSLKSIQIIIPDARSVMFEKVEGDNYIFRIGANMKVVLSGEFILANKEIDNEKVDFLICKWVFDINGNTITPREWANADLIDGSLLSDASVRVHRLLVPDCADGLNREKQIQKENRRVSRLRNAFNTLVDDMLPPKQSQTSEVPVQYIRFPTLTVSKRK